MSGKDDGGGSGAAKPAETTLTTTAASSVAQTSGIQNTNAVTSGANVTAPQKTEKAGKPMTTMMMSSKNPPKQSEEDMISVAQTARKQKEEWVRTNKDRESMHRSRTRSVEAYEKLEQVSVLDPIFARLCRLLCLVFSFFEFVFADNRVLFNPYSSLLLITQVGEGTYGMVFMAKERSTHEIVALKKVRMDNEKEGFPITAIREIKILQKLKHKNVVNLKEIVTSKAQKANDMKGSIYLVFEYMDHDLAGLADRPGMKFSEEQIKCYMKQLFQGLHYCHANNILHRDIKGSNLLINNRGILKLADFGLARSYTAEGANPLTNRVITLWYRPPELLLGARKYTPAVDMWSAGCIFAELVHGRPIMPGKNEMDQLKLIFELCGTPTPETWPDCKNLPGSKVVEFNKHPRRLREFFRHASPNALKLIEQLLTLDPEKRLTAEKAMDSDYMWDKPLPCDPAKLPQYEPSHEFQTKKRREEAKQEEVRKRQRMESGTTANVARPQPLSKQARMPGQTSVGGGGGSGGGAGGGMPKTAFPQSHPHGGGRSSGHPAMAMGFNRSAPHQGSYSSGSSGSHGGYRGSGASHRGGYGGGAGGGGYIGGGGGRSFGGGGGKYGGTQRAAWAAAPAPPKQPPPPDQEKKQ